MPRIPASGCPMPAPVARRRRYAAAWALAALTAIALQSGPPVSGQSEAPSRRTVDTTEGPVTGGVAAGVASWKGLAFAAAPTGDLRWRAPRPAPFHPEARLALDYGPRCPQDDRGDLRPGLGRTGVEDCLQLNVWAPAEASSESRLPVLFWIHGGGMVQGASTTPLYDGSGLARSEQVIVVSTNYRLGALGFLAHPAFLDQDPGQPRAGNYGLLDQQAALAWVGRNIEAFGGDPERILIFGESAGGVSVCSHMASPLARGRFAAAIMQSGNCLTTSIPALDTARGAVPAAFEQGRRFAAATGCDQAADPAACLRALPVETILDTLPGEVGLLDPGAETYGPTVDGYVLLEPPGDAIRGGRAARLPFVAGTTADEASIFLPPGPMRYAQFASLVAGLFPTQTDRILAHYPEDLYPDGRAALSAVTTDLAFGCPTRRAMRDHAAWGNPAWLYHFTRVPAYAEAAGVGSHHGVEIAYLFDSFGAALRRSLTAPDLRLTARMQSDWASLARSSAPAASDSPAWPSLGQARLAGLQLGDAISVETGWRAERCDLWDEIAGWSPLVLPAPEPSHAIHLPWLGR